MTLTQTPMVERSWEEHQHGQCGACKKVWLDSLDAGASPRTPLKQHDSYGGYTPPCVCTALCVHRGGAVPRRKYRLALLHTQLASLDARASPRIPLK